MIMNPGADPVGRTDGRRRGGPAGGRTGRVAAVFVLEIPELKTPGSRFRWKDIEIVSKASGDYLPM